MKEGGTAAVASIGGIGIGQQRKNSEVASVDDGENISKMADARVSNALIIN